MIISYNNNPHPIGEAWAQINSRARRNARNMYYARDYEVRIEGMLTSQAADPEADIKTKTAALESRYSAERGNLIIYQQDGTTQTDHVYLDSDTLNGIRIVQPLSYEDGRGTEGVTIRSWSVILGFAIPIPVSQLESVLLSFEETLSSQRTGTKFGHIELHRGLAVKQRLRQFQVHRVVQRGSAVGLYQYPTVPNPVWPALVTDGLPAVTKGHPRVPGLTPMEWPISWEWVHESALPFDGSPHIWGVTYRL